ncbi:hypothetical protein FB451DRAFT_1443950 [Mycena latifolia]|nr:hypothetical protein FB451DRAFT_1443950 [Mycena latifolia]
MSSSHGGQSDKSLSFLSMGSQASQDPQFLPFPLVWFPNPRRSRRPRKQNKIERSATSEAYIFRKKPSATSTASCLVPPHYTTPHSHTMHASTLALLLLGATAARAYPAAPMNPAHMATPAAHLLPPAPAMPMPGPDAVTNTAERDPHKRQIHNADYHANAPPPSPNPNPAAAPAPGPAPAQEPKPARAEPKHLAPGPVVRPVSACDSDMEHENAKRAAAHHVYHYNVMPVSTSASARDSTWPGWRRRAAEELADAHNPALDHDALTRLEQGGGRADAGVEPRALGLRAFSIAHGDLHLLASQLRAIHAALADFRPPAARPPILDSCTPATLADAPADDWLHAPAIPGLKQLRDALKIDLDGLQRFLDDPASARLPPLSTNAPYLIAVYNEVLCAPPPVVSVFKAFPPPTDSEQKTKAKMSGTPVKVDVVADGGRRWVRVNTIKNARLMAEFRELDSYLTDSDSDEDADDGSASNNINRPSRAQPELDNSLLRMGRALLAAASVSASASASAHAPKVTLRLTRLDPSAPDGADPRVGQTLAGLRAMGIDVQLGERPFLLPTCNTPLPPAPAPTRPLVPTQNINLDLSVLIALVSDLTHAPLPPSLAAAQRRFVPASASSSSASSTP